MKILNGILTFFGVITLLIVTLLLPPVLVTKNVERVVFDREMVWQSLENSVLSDEVLAELRSEALSDTAVDDSGAFFGDALAQMDESEMNALWAMVLPHDTLIEMVRQPFDDFYDWFDGDDAMPELTFDVTPIIDALDENKVTIFQSLSGALPACTTEEAGQYEQVFSSPDPAAQLPSCKMPASAIQQQIDTLIAQYDLNEIAPDEVLAPINFDMSETESAEIKRDIRLYRQIAQFSVWVVVGFWVIGFFLIARNMRSALRAFAAPAFFGGAMTLILGVILRISGSALAQEIAAELDPEVPSIVFIAAGKLITSFSVQLANPVLIQGALLLAAGILAFIAIPFTANIGNNPEDMSFYQQAD